MRILWITFALLSLSGAAVAGDQQDLPPRLGGDISHFLDQILSFGPQTTTCPDNQPSPVSTVLGLIGYLCHNVVQERQDVDEVLKNVRQLGGDKTLQSEVGMNFDEFADEFRYFAKVNAQIPEIYQPLPKNPWDAQYSDEMNSRRAACQFRLGRNGMSQAVQEVRFGDVHFVGIYHFAQIQPGPQVLSANQALDARLEQIRQTDGTDNRAPATVILLEGHDLKYGQPLSCESTLNSVFSGSKQGDPDEEINLVRYGFMTKTPLIPADNQYLSDSDRDTFYNGDAKKFDSLKSDFDFVDILHNYYSFLNDAYQNRHAIQPAEALEQAVARTHSSYFDAQSFKARYLQEDKHALPGMELGNVSQDGEFSKLKASLDQLFLNFAPSASLPPELQPLGSNRLVDEQDILRNRALIRAIQVSQEKFSKATVVFGSGHLEKVGTILEQQIGKFKNVDFNDNCSAQ